MTRGKLILIEIESRLWKKSSLSVPCFIYWCFLYGGCDMWSCLLSSVPSTVLLMYVPIGFKWSHAYRLFKFFMLMGQHFETRPLRRRARPPQRGATSYSEKLSVSVDLNFKSWTAGDICRVMTPAFESLSHSCLLPPT